MSALSVGDTIEGQRQYDAAPVGAVVGDLIDGVLDTDELLVRVRGGGWVDCDGVTYERVSFPRTVVFVPEATA